MSLPFRGPDPKPVTAGGIGRPKPKSRQRAGRERWDEIRTRKLAPCLVCRWQGVKQELPSTLHHIVAKSLGGSDTEANVAPVCGDGTRGHHGLLEAHDPVTCQAFAAALQQWDDQAYSYAVEKLGEDRFLRRYHVRFEAHGKRAA